ncbi:MAG: GTP-binding protein [Bacillaceae bacterium]|nr:GTP-binding protein [Bacillaceae bacterium]
MEQLLERRVGIYRTEPEKGKACGCSSYHQDDSCDNHHHHTFQAIKIELDKPINRPIFEKWLKQLPPTIVRGKGIVQLDETVGYFQFQFASGELKLQRLKDKPTVDPCLILIGVGMNTQGLLASFTVGDK